MPARSDIYVISQIGKETTPGVAVPCNRRITDLEMAFSPMIQTRFGRPQGVKIPSSGVMHREWAQGDYSGMLAYASPVYPLSSYFGAPTPVQIGATGAYTWAFVLNPTGADPFTTYTMQMGDAEAAQEVAHGIFNSMNISVTQEDANYSGGLFANPINNAASLTASPTTIERRPISIKDFDLYIDTAYSGIGVTKWAKPYEFTLNLPDKYTPNTVLNSSFPGFAEAVQNALEDMTLGVTVMFDSQTRAIFDAMKVDSLASRYIQLKAVGDNIGVGADYLFKLNAHVKLENVVPRRNVQGTYAHDFTFRILTADDFLGGIEITLVNRISAL